MNILEDQIDFLEERCSSKKDEPFAFPLLHSLNKLDYLEHNPLRDLIEKIIKTEYDYNSVASLEIYATSKQYKELFDILRKYTKLITFI